MVLASISFALFFNKNSAAAEFLLKNKAKLIDANTIDMELASQKDLQDSFVDRLELNEKRIDSMISGLDKVINLDDPVGQTDQPHTSPSGFEVSKMRVPLGVIGIIYESRPNVTADASALCLKSGNACITRLQAQCRCVRCNVWTRFINYPYHAKRNTHF